MPELLKVSIILQQMFRQVLKYGV
ncbi:MAG: hypothetical protein RLZZ29_1518, partial [Cyanobacteriota bacterium]